MPRVSVIMNVRNGAATLREASDSVVAQTFTDWEVILWDDRSADDSASIVAEYHDLRIRYWLSPEYTPLGLARDLAIREATGEWLAFLDQDDIWLPDKLQKQVALSEDGPLVGIIYGRTLAFSGWGFEFDYDHQHEFKPLPEGDIFLQLFTDTRLISMSSAMLRRSAVVETGEIPDAIQVVPDFYLFVTVARRYRARAVQTVVCRYRLHSGSMTHSSRRRMHQEALWLIDQWASDLGPELAARRRRMHATILALEDMCHLAPAPRGLALLWVRGLPGWLLSRPFALAFRALRRRVRRPLYKECR